MNTTLHEVDVCNYVILNILKVTGSKKYGATRIHADRLKHSVARVRLFIKNALTCIESLQNYPRHEIFRACTLAVRADAIPTNVIPPAGVLCEISARHETHMCYIHPTPTQHTKPTYVITHYTTFLQCVWLITHLDVTLHEHIRAGLLRSGVPLSPTETEDPGRHSQRCVHAFRRQDTQFTAQLTAQLNHAYTHIRDSIRIYTDTCRQEDVYCII